jgi:hypothetical protein
MKKYLDAIGGQIRKNFPILIPYVSGIILAWVGWLVLHLEASGIDSRLKDFQLALVDIMSEDRSWNSDSWSLLSSFVFAEPAILAIWLVAVLMLLSSAIVGVVRRLRRASKEDDRVDFRKSASAFLAFASYTSFAMVAVFFSIGLLLLEKVDKTIAVSDRDVKSSMRVQDGKIDDLVTEVSENSTANFSALNEYLEVVNARTKARLECLKSPSSRTYYYSSRASWVSSGFYDNCSLAEYLERRWDLIDKRRLEVALATSRTNLARSQNQLAEAESLQDTLRSRKAAIDAQGRFIDRSIGSSNEFLLWSFVALLLSISGLVLLKYSTHLLRFASLAKGPALRVWKAGNARIKREPRNIRCPNCAEKIRREARMCRHCGSTVE